MDFAAWIDDAWSRHADAPAAVAAELDAPDTPPPPDDAALSALLRLAHHLHGDHLATLADGRAQLARLAARPVAGDGARTDARVFDASLALTGGDDALLTALPAAARARVQALAASNLAERDATRAGVLLQAAAATADADALPDTDPAVRAMAVAAHNIAATLEERPQRSLAEQDLMVQAATLSLALWRRAGTWLHEERAHYRLAQSQRKAGHLAAARQNALACLAVVAAHGNEALEEFYGCEILALIEADAGQADALAAALARQRAAFERLDEADRAECRAPLDQIEQLARAAGSPP